MKHFLRQFLPLLTLLCSSAVAFAEPTPRATSRTTVNPGPTYDININGSTAGNAKGRSDYAGGYDAYGHDYHPIDMTAAATANVMPTPAPVGAILYTPPPDYSAVVVGGVSYMKSGEAWYQPRFTGTAMTYVVIPSLN